MIKQIADIMMLIFMGALLLTIIAFLIGLVIIGYKSLFSDDKDQTNKVNVRNNR